MDGNFACGSVVSQQRKFGWGCRLLISFSSSGTQLMTRCRFLRQIQSPDLAASCRSRRASSLWPPPMAIWCSVMLGFEEAACCFANSSSSCDGSPPGVVTKRIGILEVVSSSCSRGRLRAGGESEETPMDSQENCVSADSSRSGRTAWMSRTLWKDDIREKMEPSKDSSHLSEATQGCQMASLPNCQCSSTRGKAARSVCSCCARSGGHQEGAFVAGAPDGMKVPWKSSHSFGSNLSGMILRTMWRPKVRRSALKSEREQ
mmetsp:Transcript_55732/g.158248  ORF Transcript_55732/g.158248 Transcript_55732/m.158248 type:complete len:260 (+) Transcript_55732:680-1459(+)